MKNIYGLESAVSLPSLTEREVDMWDDLMGQSSLYAKPLRTS